MSSAFSWHVIVNLRTCKKAGWTKWKSRLETHHIKHTFHFSESISHLSDIISELLQNGERHFLFAGGDGTLHHGGNLLLDHAGPVANEIIIGVLPCGSGNDWVRTFTPGNILTSILQHQIAPLNGLYMEWQDGRTRYAFNMIGGALDAAVVDTLRAGNYRWAGSLKYGLGLVQCLYNHHTWRTKIIVDDQQYSGEWLSFQAGFGKYCGGGMLILPHVTHDKPAVLLMRTKSIMRILFSLPALYNGNIIHKKEAKAMLFDKILISKETENMPLEADGEWLGYSPVTITVRRNIMKRLDTQ